MGEEIKPDFIGKDPYCLGPLFGVCQVSQRILTPIGRLLKDCHVDQLCPYAIALRTLKMWTTSEPMVYLNVVGGPKRSLRTVRLFGHVAVLEIHILEYSGHLFCLTAHASSTLGIWHFQLVAPISTSFHTFYAHFHHIHCYLG